MRTLQGTVVSAKMKKTVVVQVPLTRKNAKYQKTYEVARRFKAHDEKGECVAGDRVIIKEVPPISREKRWMVIEIISSGKRPATSSSDI
mgnify:CR=1 FL=1